MTAADIMEALNDLRGRVEELTKVYYSIRMFRMINQQKESERAEIERRYWRGRGGGGGRGRGHGRGHGRGGTRRRGGNGGSGGTRTGNGGSGRKVAGNGESGGGGGGQWRETGKVGKEKVMRKREQKKNTGNGGEEGGEVAQ